MSMAKWPDSENINDFILEDDVRNDSPPWDSDDNIPLEKFKKDYIVQIK